MIKLDNKRCGPVQGQHVRIDQLEQQQDPVPLLPPFTSSSSTVHPGVSIDDMDYDIARLSGCLHMPFLSVDEHIQVIDRSMRFHEK